MSIYSLPRSCLRPPIADSGDHCAAFERACGSRACRKHSQFVMPGLPGTRHRSKPWPIQLLLPGQVKALIPHTSLFLSISTVLDVLVAGLAPDLQGASHSHSRLGMQAVAFPVLSPGQQVLHYPRRVSPKLPRACPYTTPLEPSASDTASSPGAYLDHAENPLPLVCTIGMTCAHEVLQRHSDQMLYRLSSLSSARCDAFMDYPQSGGLHAAWALA